MTNKIPFVSNIEWEVVVDAGINDLSEVAINGSYSRRVLQTAVVSIVDSYDQGKFKKNKSIVVTGYSSKNC